MKPPQFMFRARSSSSTSALNLASNSSNRLGVFGQFVPNVVEPVDQRRHYQSEQAGYNAENSEEKYQSRGDSGQATLYKPFHVWQESRRKDKGGNDEKDYRPKLHQRPDGQYRQADQDHTSIGELKPKHR